MRGYIMKLSIKNFLAVITLMAVVGGNTVVGMNFENTSLKPNGKQFKVKVLVCKDKKNQIQGYKDILEKLNDNTKKNFEAENFWVGKKEFEMSKKQGTPEYKERKKRLNILYEKQEKEKYEKFTKQINKAEIIGVCVIVGAVVGTVLVYIKTKNSDAYLLGVPAGVVLGLLAGISLASKI